jgi:hypothetical protein
MFKFLFRFTNRIPWRYAVGEVLLIFIGITLSLWFNEWDGDRKQRELELKTLREIKNEILLDTIDLNINLAGYREMIRSDTVFENFFMGGMGSEKQPSVVPTGNDLAQLNNAFMITLQTSAYETLKARGIDLIGNDSLRLSIIRLYDFDYKVLESLENTGMMKDIRREMHPYFVRNIKMITRRADGHPHIVFAVKDTTALKNDDDFWTTFQQRKYLNRRMLTEYIGVRDKISQLSRAIDREIDQFP